MSERTFAFLSILEEVTPSLFRVMSPEGQAWLRVGTDGARARRFAQLDVPGWGPFSVVEDGEQVGLVCVAAHSVPVVESTRARLFGSFQQLAVLVDRLHNAGMRLDGLDPEGLREGVVLPMLTPHRPWCAPEGSGRAGDWYVVGQLLYAALTGEREFPWYGVDNGPDPRDLAPRSPETLSALAIDLLLLDPNERPEGREVLEELIEPSDGPVEDRVDRLLRTGGLAVMPLSWRDRLEGLMRAVPLSKAGPRIEKVSQLSKRARTQIGALLVHPSALSPAHRARAARQLGQALSIAGVPLTWIAEPDAVHQSILVDVLRARPSPAVVVLSDTPLEALSDLCTASGIRVDGDPRSPTQALAGLDFREGSPVLRSGDVSGLADQLGDLGVPRRAGLTGRALDTVAGWVPPRPGDGLSDASRPRMASRLASELAWVRPEQAVLVARWSRREAIRAGDPEAGAIIHLVDAALTGGLPQGEPDGEHAEDVLVFGRALAHRHRGDCKAAIGVLEDVLPLVSLGPAENGAAGLLVAESLVQTGAWKRAALVLRSLQVDARRTGNHLLDIGCLALAQRMGFDLQGELERMLEGVDLGVGVLSWWVAMARSIQAKEPRDALAILQGCRVFDRWPLRLAGAPAVEARMFALQLAWAAGEPPSRVGFVHPRAEAWRALADAWSARQAADAEGVIKALEAVEQRYEGAHASLNAACAKRVRGLWIGGSKGGNLVAQADSLLAKQGCRVPPHTTRLLLPGW